MTSKQVNLGRVATNETNPRQISEDRFESLVKSILVLPKMLAIRPVAVDANMVALGGNMRLQALNHIVGLGIGEIENIIFNAQTDKGQEEQKRLVDYWREWQKEPTVTIVDASNLSEAEQKEFIIKDNLGYGKWDWDKLANEWDEELLIDWGFDKSYFSDAPNVDDLFEDMEAGQKDKDMVISVHLTGEDKDHYEDIKAIIEQTLINYSNIKVR